MDAGENHFLLGIYRGIKSLQGCFGGAKWISAIHGTTVVDLHDCLITFKHWYPIGITEHFVDVGWRYPPVN